MIKLVAVVLLFVAGFVQPEAEHAAVKPSPRTDAWWTQRNDSFNERAKQGAGMGDIGVVFLGDSITQGWEDAGRDVWQQRYEARRAVNFGIGGDRTQHVIWRVENGNLEGLARPKEGAPPRLVMLMIGTNNTGSDTAEQIAAGIEGVVKAVRKKLPETPVLLLGVFPRGEKVDDPLRSKIADINSRISMLDDGKKVVYLDIGEKFVGEGGAISKEIMPDFLHLSPKGYQIWAEAIEPTMARMLGEAPAK